jgi:hypothetical protein
MSIGTSVVRIYSFLSFILIFTLSIKFYLLKRDFMQSNKNLLMFLSTTGTWNIMQFFIYYCSFVILKLLLFPR